MAENLLPFAVPLYLSKEPARFSAKLIDWGREQKHEDSILVIPYEVRRFIDDKSTNYFFNGHTMCAILDNFVIIASNAVVENNSCLVVDEIIQTFPVHKIVYRVEGINYEKVFQACFC